jgi:hypothetical protein
MPGGNQPSVSATGGRTVTVSWAASTLPGPTPVNGYIVARYDAGSGTPASIGASCTGTIAALTCSETRVPPGSWVYAVTPRHGQWAGAQSPSSLTVTVASPSLSLAPGTVTSLPAIPTGSIASFITGETLTYRLDDPVSGTLLTSTTTPSTIGTNGSASVSVTIPAGTSEGSHTVYALGSLGTQASTSIVVDAIDGVAPTVSAVAIAKSTGGKAGSIRQGGGYYTYANVTDPGPPTSGIATVTANVSTVTTGATAVAMTAGSWTVDGVTYNYRTALQTATTPQAAGSKSFSITARDGNANQTVQNGSVDVDNTVPTASDVQATNAGTAGTATAGDTLTLSYSEPIDPNTISAGWTGASTTVTVRFTNNGGGDRITIANAANTAVLPLGTVFVNRTDFVTANGTATSTMTMSGSSITIVFGTPSGGVSTMVAAANMTWTPSATATDWAGNACATTTRTETGALDLDF